MKFLTAIYLIFFGFSALGDQCNKTNYKEFMYNKNRTLSLFNEGKRCELSNTNFRGANFRNAILLDADFRGADLRNADFIGADLWDADFNGADTNLTDADFRNAILWDADFSYVKNLNGADFSHVQI